MRSKKIKTFAFAAIVTASVAGLNVRHDLLHAAHGNAADLRLVLNIPSSKIDVYEKGVRTHTYEVSPGARGFTTPAGSYNISLITWNPWWHPPKSEWARREKITPPGPKNPMGPVKLNFAKLLYIHGTPWVDDLGAPASHGCIRMNDSDVVELTRLIHRYRTPGISERLLSQLQNNRTMTRTFHIKPVLFEVTYQLVEVRDDHLIIHPDVYRETASRSLHDDVVTALREKGIAVTPALERRLGPIAMKRNATTLKVSIDSLVSGD